MKPISRMVLCTEEIKLGVKKGKKLLKHSLLDMSSHHYGYFYLDYWGIDTWSSLLPYTTVTLSSSDPKASSIVVLWSHFQKWSRKNPVTERNKPCGFHGEPAHFFYLPDPRETYLYLQGESRGGGWPPKYPTGKSLGHDEDIRGWIWECRVLCPSQSHTAKVMTIGEKQNGWLKSITGMNQTT